MGNAVQFHEGASLLMFTTEREKVSQSVKASVQSHISTFENQLWTHTPNCEVP